jgi:hypothetical protein
MKHTAKNDFGEPRSAGVDRPVSGSGKHAELPVAPGSVIGDPVRPDTGDPTRPEVDDKGKASSQQNGPSKANAPGTYPLPGGQTDEDGGEHDKGPRMDSATSVSEQRPKNDRSLRSTRPVSSAPQTPLASTPARPDNTGGRSDRKTSNDKPGRPGSDGSAAHEKTGRDSSAASKESKGKSVRSAGGDCAGV